MSNANNKSANTTNKDAEEMTLADKINALAPGHTGGQEKAVADTTATPPAAPQQDNVTLTQRNVPAPQNVATGLVRNQEAIRKNAETVTNKIVASGVIVKETGPVADNVLPEFVEAMKVGKMQTQSALGSLLEYVRDMHPGKPQTEKSIEANQIKLLNALYTILISEDVNFPKVFKGVVAVFKAHRNNAFRVTMRNRGLNSISLSAMDNKNMRFLTRVVDLLHVASGLNDMTKAKEHVDMTKLLEAVTNVRAKQNLTAFFS